MDVCVEKGGQRIKLTMPPVIEDASLEIFDLREALDSCDTALDGIIGVLLASGRSSTFLAIATVSALREKAQKQLSEMTKKMLKCM